MIQNYIAPLIISLLFIIVVYLNKYINYKLQIRNEDTSVIVAVSLFTIIAVIGTYYISCQSQSLTQCFYLKFDVMAIIKVLIGNTILFSTHILTKSTFIFQKPFHLKALVVGPIVEEILFRAVYFAISHQQPNIYFLSLIFSVAHLHHLISPILKGGSVNINAQISMLVFTFVFGLYCFYALKLTRCIWSAIFLHSYCNYLGPPMLQNYLIPHLISLGGFIAFNYLAY